MKKILLLGIGVWWLALAEVMAQPRISGVRFEVNSKDKLIEITYDVFGIRMADSIYVTVAGKTSGNIVPRSLSGAVGRGVKPGSGRKIYWDVVADGLKIDEEIEVKVQLELAEAYALAGRDTTGRPPKTVVKRDRKGLNGGALVVLGGGLAAGGGLYYWSTLMKEKSIASYDLYKIRNWNHKQDISIGTDTELQRRLTASIEQSDADFKKAKTQQTLSKVMLIGGIALAVTDAFFTIPALLQKKNNRVGLRLDMNPWGVASAGVNVKF